MLNLRDKELDDLSREAAEHHELGNTPPSWDKLSKRLDEELPQEKDRDRKPFIFFFLLICLIAGGAYLLLPGNEPAGKTTKSPGIVSNTDQTKTANTQNGTGPAVDEKKSFGTKTTDPTETTVANNLAKPLAAPTTNNQIKKEPGVTIVVPSNTTVKDKKRSNGSLVTIDPDRNHLAKSKSIIPSFDQDENLAATNTGKKKKQASAQQNKAGAGVDRELNAVTKKKDEKSDKSKEDEADLDKQADQTKDADKQDTVNPNDTKDGHPLNHDSASGKLTVKPQPQTNSDPVNVTADKTVLQKKKGEGSTLSPFSIALQLGADVSTVKFTHSDDAGYSVGVLGGYRFNKNLSLYTGLNYTKKKYTLYGKDYHPPKGTWPATYKIDEVDGFCNMFEWPILARYSFNKPGNNRLFVSTGLSTYFMQKEDYDYSYKVMGNPYRRNWKYDGHDNYWLSIVHLSFGFEQKINKNLSWVVEPYAKLPLAGVGYGNIKLSSYGLNVFLQLRPNKKSASSR